MAVMGLGWIKSLNCVLSYIYFFPDKLTLYIYSILKLFILHVASNYLTI